MRTTSMLVAAVAVLALANTVSAQTTITSYDPVTHTYRVTTTSGPGTYVITPSGPAAVTSSPGIITVTPSAANAVHATYNPGGTTPFYAGDYYPFGYVGSFTSL